MYQSPGDAISADRRGGTGFFVSVPLEGAREKMFYVVTARHVFELGYRTARFNLVTGGTTEHEIPEDLWSFPENGADVAVAPALGIQVALKGHAVPFETIVTRDFCTEADIGPGDTVCMAGRLMHHDGKIFNRPAVRFGNISVMPDEPARA